MASLPPGIRSPRFATNDSLRSLVSGMGDPGRDKLASVFHGLTVLSDEQLVTSYRSSWMIRKAVDIPAKDALRKGRDWQAEQKDITLIEAEEKRLGVIPKLLECKTKARLFGGAAIVIGDGSADYSEPFDFEHVKKNGIKYLTVMTRLNLSAGQLSIDPESEWFDKPEYYTLDSVEGRHMTVHPSRMVVMIGAPHPDPRLATGHTTGWGDSVVQVIYDQIMRADSVDANIASLVFEANVDSFGIPDFMDQIGTEEYRKRFLDRMMLADVGKSITRSIVHDSAETYNRNTISFTGLSDVKKQAVLMVSGAVDIPLTRFLGQTPSGLSTTGEGDMKNYYDQVQSIQELEITPAIWRLDEALIRSALGARPDDIFYNWSPLEQLNEAQQAEVGHKCAQAAEILSRIGVFSSEELREAVANQLVENGFYPGLGEIMKQTGEFNPDLGGGDEPGENDQGVTGDAKPRTLYMRRDVLNAAEIVKHYVDQGVEGVYSAESMHTTIVYSKTPVDWMKIGQAWQAELKIAAGGPRLHELFGDKGDILVLAYASDELKWRNRSALESGATSDFDEYQPHISITLRGDAVDLETLNPWTGEIILGPEVFEEIDTDVEWRSKVVTV